MVLEQRKFIPVPDSGGEHFMPTSLPVDPEKYATLIQLGKSDSTLRKRNPWDFIFSVGQNGEIFPFTRFGYTKPEERVNLRGVSGFLDTLADTCVAMRGPGRFFINPTGAFFKDKENILHQVAIFTLQEQTARTINS